MTGVFVVNAAPNTGCTRRKCYVIRGSATKQARCRGEIAVRIAAGKLRISEDGLEVATKVFELTGARASANSVGLDIYWRNLRTHSLHDPAPYKKREVGQYVLLNEVPEPSW